jgi:hypothetical protein
MAKRLIKCKFCQIDGHFDADCQKKKAESKDTKTSKSVFFSKSSAPAAAGSDSVDDSYDLSLCPKSIMKTTRSLNSRWLRSVFDTERSILLTISDFLLLVVWLIIFQVHQFSALCRIMRLLLSLSVLDSMTRANVACNPDLRATDVAGLHGIGGASKLEEIGTHQLWGEVCKKCL